MRLSVGYLHLADHIILARNATYQPFLQAQALPTGRPDPNWGNIPRYESSGNSYYDGMVVSFNQRLRLGEHMVLYAF
jgi:hypothetical protein